MTVADLTAYRSCHQSTIARCGHEVRGEFGWTVGSNVQVSQRDMVYDLLLLLETENAVGTFYSMHDLSYT